MKKSFLKFFNILIVLFTLLVFLELLILRPIGIMDGFIPEKEELLSGFRKNNFMFLVGFSNEVSNNESYVGLNYILIPKGLSMPSIIYVHKSSGGDIEHEEGSNLQAVFAILILLYGVYIIVSYLKSFFINGKDLDTVSQ